MVKYINVRNNKEVKVGDVIKVAYTTYIPYIGKAVVFKEEILTEEKLKNYIEEGKIKVEEEAITSFAIFSKAINNLQRKTGYDDNRFIDFITTLKNVDALITMKLITKELANVINSKYNEPVSNSERVYSISSENGSILEFKTEFFSNFNDISIFRTKEDAELAKKCLSRMFNFKTLFPNA